MAKKEKKEDKGAKFKKPEAFQDKDNPSLIEIAGALKLRVFEDFYVERETQKWKSFEERKKALSKILHHQIDSWGSGEKLAELKKTNHEEYERCKKEYDLLKKMQKDLDDDRYNIQGKHEREFDESLDKMVVAVTYTPRTWREKIRGVFKKRAPKPVTVEVAFKDLKKTILTTSTDQLAKMKQLVDEMIAKYNSAGQYNKAQEIAKFSERIILEQSVVSAGFTKYLTEAQMVDFLKKSEKGVIVNFLRYYEDLIPSDVIEKKVKADNLQVFDNFVIAWYADLTEFAKTKQKKRSEDEQKKVTAKRRDPILFGVIKGIRKLYYIADWTTDQDDLTLKMVEKTLGVKAGRLMNPKKPSMPLVAEEYEATEEDRLENRIRRIVYEHMAERDIYTSTMTPFGSPSAQWASEDTTLSSRTRDDGVVMQFRQTSDTFGS